MIDTFFNILRKGFVAALALMFAFVLIYIPQEFSHHQTVSEAQAFLGVDIPNLVQNTISAVAGVAIHLKEFTLDGIAWAIAKAIVARMVSSLVDWINSGFKGSPAFISDLKRYLLVALDEAAGSFIQDLTGDASFLCDPFKLDIQIAIALEYENIREDKPFGESCKLSDMVHNVKDFFTGTFEEGGWKDWITVTSQPEKYTPYGQMLQAEQGLARQLAKTEKNERDQAAWASGFKSTKVCETVQKPAGGTTVRCSIATLGRTISDHLSKSLGAGQDTLVTADEISEIIGALIGQLAQKAVTGINGLLGLSSGTGYTYSGYAGGSYTGAATTQAYNQGSTQNGTSNVTLLTDSLDIQQKYKALADAKIPTFQAYLRNVKNPIEKLQVVDSYLAIALKVQEKAPGYITKLSEMIASYNELDAEYNKTGTTLDRKNEIRQEQLNIMSQFSNLGAYDKAEYEGSVTTWDLSRL